MIKLDAGNVLLKPSQRRQLMTWLRRSQRLGERLGNFVLSISIRRIGRFFEVRAAVSDKLGAFDCRSKRHDWQTAVRELIRSLTLRLKQQCLMRTAVA